MASIRKRGNSYTIAVSCGYDIHAKQLVEYMTWKPKPGMTEKQIEKELNRQAVLFEEKCQQGMVIDSNIKLIDFEERYFRDHGKNLRKQSIQGYRDLLPVINESLGHMRLSKIRPHHLLSFYDNLEEKGIRRDAKYRCTIDLLDVLKKRSLTKTAFCAEASICPGVLTSIRDGKNVTKKSAEKISTALGVKVDSVFTLVDPDKKLSKNTILHYHRFLSSMFSVAMDWQILSDNPCKHIKAPKVGRLNPAYYDDETAVEMLSCLELEPIKYRTLIYLYIHMGYRRGEALGLKWPGIDFERCLIDIGRAVYYLPQEGVFEDDTKNSPSQRVSKAPPIIMDKLKEYKAWQNEQRLKVGDQWVDEGYVFTQWNGKPMNPDSVTSWFKSFVLRHELPYLSIKGLRHTNATLQIAGGTPLTTVAARLGHANTNTTSRVYAHAIRTADAAAAELIGDTLALSKQMTNK